MSRLQTAIVARLRKGEKILSIYITAGFPQPEATVPLLQAIAEAGADVIELGVPFSDPLADGPTIQAASQRALQAGTTVAGSFDLLARFRQAQPQIPVILMGYANPFMRFGWDTLFRQARASGADGFIVPDLPPEESADLQRRAAELKLDWIHLVSPNTPPHRIERIDRQSSGFVYAVSVTGVTGARDRLPDSTRQFLQRLREQTTKPVLVGFGVSGPEMARQLARYCDGVIVGSAVIREIEAAGHLDEAIRRVRQFVAAMRAALSEE